MEDTTMVERQEVKPQPDKPIVETPDSVSYLGVQLPKAKIRDSQYVPRREAYADYVNDPEIALPMQRVIAVNFLQGDPLLIEAGTEIGKTTTVRKMASELGYEVHYANLNGATDVEDFMGRYIPNPNRHSAEDPEYIFADGKVTSGLRQEEGKIKIILLDEFNSAAPNILIRLHEVVDALQRGDNVVLTEDASETVPANKEITKIVALMNPPGKGYIGREPLDPAQLRRWVYYKAPTNLPKEAFTHFLDEIGGLSPRSRQLSSSEYIFSREQALLLEQLQEIPGFVQIWREKYPEFHAAAQELVKNRGIAADQPQLFTYGDRTEPRRVRDFVLCFYNGDINQTIQTALRFYYANKVESAEDKAKLEELIRHVEFIPPQNVSQRRGLDRVDVSPAPTPAAPEVPVPDSTGEQRRWQDVLGSRVEVKPIPSSITPEVRRNLEALGLELVYLPKLELGTLADLKRLGEGRFLDDLQRRYPKWKHYESMRDTEKEDHSVSRNLNEWYWGLVKDGKVDFPGLSGQWMAVEKVEKPAYRSKYPRTPLAEKLGFRDDRFNVSWNDAHNAIEREKRKILSEIGLPGRESDLRLLETVEWNLLGNREGWGKTNTYEWTNTEYRESGDSDRLVVGDSDLGGAAYVYWDPPGLSYVLVGFRAAVVLGS